MSNWDFCKKILIFIVRFLFIFFILIALVCLFLYVLNLIRKVFYLDMSYFTDIPRSLYETSDYDKFYRNYNRYITVRYALDSMHYNEYYFYFHPNTEAFIQSKIKYQEELKILSDKLNFQDFENPDEGLKFLTAFYEHYLKIIELNYDLIKSKKL